MKKVFLGADNNSKLREICSGKRCGLLTSATGIDSSGIPTYIKLSEMGALSVLFSPEHGIHSVMQDGLWSGQYIDKETGAPVFDLKGSGNPEIDKALSICDIILYDIQDVGARFYTYIYCLTYLMEKCAEKGIPVYVLDRPDPISGNLDKIEGPVLDEAECSSSIGRYAIPTRYALTVGEFAKYINSVKGINCELSVISCENWSRDIYWDETSLIWVNPSPNIPNVNCAVNYIGTCLIEATNVSEGRGTTRPFDIIGAPFIDSRSLCDNLNSIGLDGVRFTRAFFTPMFNKWQGEVCEGVQINITDRSLYEPHKTGLYLLSELSKFKEFSIRPESLALRYGNKDINDYINSPDRLIANEIRDIENYKHSIKDYLIYD